MQESNNFKISREQIILLIVGAAGGAYTYNFTWIIPSGGRAVSIIGLLSIVPIIPLVFWLLSLRKDRPEDTIFEIIESGLGKVTSKSIIIIYYFITMISIIILMNLFTQTVKIYFLQYTPAWILMLLIIIMCYMFVNSGIKIFVMFCEIIIVLATIDFHAGFALAFVKQFKIENFIPLFDITLSGFLKSIIFIMGNLSEVLMMFMLLINVMPDSKKCLTWIVKGLILWAVIYAAAGVIFIGIIGVEQLARVSGTGVAVAKVIQIGDFIRGLEVFIFVVYVNQAIAKLCIFLYSMQQAGLRLIGKSKSKIHLIIAAILVFIGSIIMNSYVTAYFVSVFLYTYILLPFSIFVLILGSLGLAISNRKRGIIE
ncbi:MAG: GerAB/ArcD/ProY family transporter [Deltaproteobacteria bacterium]